VNSNYLRVRHYLKRHAESALSSSGAKWIARHRVRGKRLILAYHGIVPEGAQPTGERSLHIGEKDFLKHLDILVELADVVPLTQIDEAGNGRPRVAITFDDAYQGAVTVGLRELARRALPATLFIAPALLERHVFWWDAMAHWSGAIDDSVRQYALNQFVGSNERVRGWASAAGLPSCDRLPDYARAATRAELGAALALPGMTVGSHTWSHVNLASLSIPDVAVELARSRDWLVAEFGDRAVPWLAYPYGLHTEKTMRAVAAAGYDGALQITGGWHRPADVSPFARPRLNVSAGVSAAGFRARLLGTLRT
jgi:peptidoglycan/xylan/chitin deacetylase (PgdA/CDA1 family)